MRRFSSHFMITGRNTKLQFIVAKRLFEKPKKTIITVALRYFLATNYHLRIITSLRWCSVVGNTTTQYA